MGQRRGVGFNHQYHCMNIDAVANAKGTEAYAYAYGENAVSQSAFAKSGADATATITNPERLTSMTWRTQQELRVTSAYAYNYDAIHQQASAKSGGDAKTSLTGAGTINIGAIANAMRARTFTHSLTWTGYIKRLTRHT